MTRTQRAGTTPGPNSAPISTLKRLTARLNAHRARGRRIQDRAGHVPAQLDDDLRLLGRRRRAAPLEHALERRLRPLRDAEGGDDAQLGAAHGVGVGREADDHLLGAAGLDAAFHRLDAEAAFARLVAQPLETELKRGRLVLGVDAARLERELDDARLRGRGAQLGRRQRQHILRRRVQQRGARGARAGGLLLGREHVARARPGAAAQHERLPTLLVGHLDLEQLEKVLARVVGCEARVHPQPLAGLDCRLGRRHIERRQRAEVGVARRQRREQQPQCKL
eukprot:scaffold70882_cov62-Phaeocystis_antarctica.AAC.4